MTDRSRHPMRTLRQARGMRQRDLAQFLGIAQPTVGKYERGIWTPALALRIRIATVLGVSTLDIWPDEPLTTAPPSTDATL